MKEDKRGPQALSKKSKKKILKSPSLPKHLEHVNVYAAGIDIGSTSHFVAVPEGTSETSVREFKAFTPNLYELADWLKECGVQTVAMESTGVYWIPTYEILEGRGFDVRLVDSRQTKNVSGRKTDVLDCQWIQQLHTYGLLKAAFRPADEIIELRSYVRQRTMLTQSAARHIQHMQKALDQMNLHLHHVISDLSGETGMKIVRSIVQGERNPATLAKMRNYRCKSSIEEIQLALTGNYRTEHLFALKQSLELYDFFIEKVKDCDQEIEKRLKEFSGKGNDANFSEKVLKSKKENRDAPDFDLDVHLYRLTGVNLLEIPGINALSALQLIGEIGLDMTRWKNAKQFASWLSLCPGNKVSGGKKLSGKTRPSRNRAATTLRMAAASLYRSKSALGAFLRRMKARKGPPKAITATAHKLAKILYNMLRYGRSYKDSGQGYYEEQYRDRVVKNLKRKATELGFSLVAISNNAKIEDKQIKQLEAVT